MKKSFTLLETLVALSILSLIAVSLIPSVYNSITSSSRADDSYELVLEMQEIIEGYKSEHFNNLEHKKYDNCLIKEELFGNYKKVEFTYKKEGVDDMELELSLILPIDISMYIKKDGDIKNE